MPRDQAHYLATVLRKSIGDDIRMFNETDGEWRARIKDISRHIAVVDIMEPLRAPYNVPDITLCFAPVRKHRTTFIIEKAVELGVRHIQPVITARTQFPKLNLTKARLQIIEAAQQTERLDIPVISEGLPLMALIADWSIDRKLIFADEAGGALPALRALQGINGPAAILIGPAGGFTPKERSVLREQSFITSVSLGPRILRADTAALSLLTMWQAVQGDWQTE